MPNLPNVSLARLLQRRGDIWRAGQAPCPDASAIPTGFSALDGQLAGNGWPRGAITEILGGGGSALALLAPALARFSGESGLIVLVAPPYLPYAPGLALRGIELSHLLLLQPQAEQDRLWALEQSLRSGCCSAVLAWPGRLSIAQLRRLQLAAEAGECSGFLFRPALAAEEASPAALRLRWHEDGTLDLLKRRGGWPVAGVRI